jgi:radical SAM protein with 4Fe4S-binding SPASM domain
MLARYASKLIFKRNSMPVYITFFVTNRCNFRCQHCFYSSELNSPTQELSLDEIRKMSRSMGNFPILLYSGGEPFLRNDLAEMTRIFYNQNNIRYLAIPTNGSFMEQSKITIEKICRICPKLEVVLIYSIDGFEKEHNYIRGNPNAFQNAIAAFTELKALKSRYHNLKIGFSMTYNSSNQKNIDQLYIYLKRLCPDSISINLIRGHPKDPKLKDVDIKGYRAVTKHATADLFKKTMPGYGSYLVALAKYRYNMIYRTFRSNKYQMPCYSSRLSCVIYPNGDVYPCELLDSSKKIGNIRDYNLNFKKLWHSNRNRRLAEWIAKSRCFCTHECNMGCNTTFNLKHFMRMGLDTVKLTLKKMIM